MIVGVDFDRVVFDTDAFDEELKSEVEGFHHTEEEPYDDNGNYSPERHAEILGIDAEEIYSAAAEIAGEFLHDDVDELEQVPAEVAIVTRGEERFQRVKIENSGILEHVENYVVVEEGDKQVAGVDLLVDDRQEELEKVDVPGFRFDRGKHTMEDLVEWVAENAA